jgi:hypothetical protein
VEARASRPDASACTARGTRSESRAREGASAAWPESTAQLPRQSTESPPTRCRSGNGTRKPVRVAAGGACREGRGAHLVEGGPEAHPLLRRGGPGESWEGNLAHSNGFSIRGIINCEELGRRIDYIYIYMGYPADFNGFSVDICMLSVDNLNISTVFYVSIPAVYNCMYTNSMCLYFTDGILCTGTDGVLRTTAAIKSKRPAPSNRFKTSPSSARIPGLGRRRR